MDTFESIVKGKDATLSLNRLKSIDQIIKDICEDKQPQVEFEIKISEPEYTQTNFISKIKSSELKRLTPDLFYTQDKMDNHLETLDNHDSREIEVN